MKLLFSEIGITLTLLIRLLVWVPVFNELLKAKSVIRYLITPAKFTCQSTCKCITQLLSLRAVNAILCRALMALMTVCKMINDKRKTAAKVLGGSYS